MARTHARIYTSVWKDPDWRKLSQAAQHTYWMLTSHPDISHCGVQDFIPGRLVECAGDLTEAKVNSAVRSLERARFLVVDRKTRELFVRSFIRHDDVLARRNMGHACGRALGSVHSNTLRDAILHELARLWSEDAGREGWAGFKDYDPTVFDMACAMARDME